MIIVYGIKEKLNPIKAQLSDVIHGCMQTVLDMPEDKRAHRRHFRLMPPKKHASRDNTSNHQSDRP